jgi:probable phosphoglycerate mutase
MWDELEKNHQEALVSFDDFTAPDGESTAQLLDRLRDFFDSLSPGRYLCFTHGGPIRAVLRAVGQDHLVSPCTVVAVDWSEKQLLWIRAPEEN